MSDTRPRSPTASTSPYGLEVRSQEIYADFEKGLTESKENEIEKTTKNQDGHYQTKKSTGLDKSNAELTSDKENVEVELSAVAKSLEKMEDEELQRVTTENELANQDE